MTDKLTKTQIADRLREHGIDLTPSQVKKTPIADLQHRLATELRKQAKPARVRDAGMIPAKRDFKPFRDGTKQAELFRLMSRKNGATLDELCAATGWTKGAVKSAFYLDLAKMHGVGVRTEGGRHHAVVGHE